MYVAMLDASKAFDKVNHWEIFTTTTTQIDRGSPAFTVRIFYYWFNPVRCCNSFSKSYIFSNGRKQSLNPRLFNVNMDDLSVNLNKLQIGFLYAGIIFNANDLSIFSHVGRLRWEEN